MKWGSSVRQLVGESCERQRLRRKVVGAGEAKVAVAEAGWGLAGAWILEDWESES